MFILFCSEAFGSGFSRNEKSTSFHSNIRKIWKNYGKNLRWGNRRHRPHHTFTVTVYAMFFPTFTFRPHFFFTSMCKTKLVLCQNFTTYRAQCCKREERNSRNRIENFGFTQIYRLPAIIFNK
jgi:hypothetical protein